MKDRTAFLTGSHAYGEPHFGSDIDVCILIDEDTEGALYRLADGAGAPVTPLDDSDYEGQQTIRFGDLNLIHFTDRWEFDAWREATEHLKALRFYYGPVSRQAAKARIIATVERRRPTEVEISVEPILRAGAS